MDIKTVHRGQEETRRYLPAESGTIPRSPGVYLMRDGQDNILYVGKAINLRSRVTSYFRAGDGSPKTALLVKHVQGIDVIVTGNEVEALILENTLIKKHRPRYNINLKDDKTYPFLQLTLKDEYPRLIVTRTVKRDGSQYFGPYPHARDARLVARMIEECFGLCQRGKMGRDPKNGRSCLNWQIGRCAGACIGRITPEGYRERVNEARRVLRGSIDELAALAEAKMKEAAAALEYEQAGFWRDRLRALRILLDKQKVVDTTGRDYDCAGVAADGERAAVTLLQVRSGKLIGKRSWLLAVPLAVGEVLEGFLGDFYDGDHLPPARIVIQELPENAEIIRRWLTGRRGVEVQLDTPRTSERDLLAMACKNSHLALVDRAPDSAPLQALTEALELPDLPGRIECYDISNLSGTLAVGSMVVFEEGRAAPREYRKFRIKNVVGIDDYAMMAEMLDRRFRRLLDGEGRRPDLLVIDGGKGHLNVCVERLAAAGLKIRCCSLAKQEEMIFRPEVDEPLLLPRAHDGLRLLQRLRDEAHRFAISYHRSLRGKKLVTSRLEAVPGLGRKKVKALFDHFGDIERIMHAPVSELVLVPGISERIAGAIVEFFVTERTEREKEL